MKRYLYCCFLLVTTAIFSQNRTTYTNDEYIKLQSKIRTLIGSNIDSAFIFANQLERSNNYMHKAFAIGAKSYLFQLKGDSIKSKEYYYTAFNYLKKVPSSKDKLTLNASLLNFGGLSDWRRKDLSLALDKYNEGKLISEKTGDIIQTIKFRNNISLINADIGNYELAINAAKSSDKLIDRFQSLYSAEQYVNNKAITYFNIGDFYFKHFLLDRSKSKKLDSASFYINKSILYSKNLVNHKTNGQVLLSTIYFLQKKYALAEKNYQNLLFFTKNNQLDLFYYNACYSVGDFYFELKKFDKALLYFNKVDSINAKKKYNSQEFINSNYYLAKIYEFKNEPEKAVQYSKKYLDLLEKNAQKLNDEASEVNSKLEKIDVKKEMINVQEKYKYEMLFKNGQVLFLVLLFLTITVFLIKNINEKKIINKRINILLEEYNSKINEELSNEVTKENSNSELPTIETKKESVIINIDLEKEEEIIERLKSLEKKSEYLKSDFTQQTVAKKIKTNTTYLSYVVNKRFGKTFSEYSNELKINYVINEMISNPTYRKYSTQAIAESVGFKNAISFTKSFNKRTGVTPVQFIKRLDQI